MVKSYPGFLYGKSLLAEEKPSGAYRVFFSHGAIRPYSRKIDSLLDSFQWRQDGASPVVVAERVEDGQILFFRLIDAGKDEYGRSRTLRAEVFLTPEEDFPSLRDGRFSAIPHADEQLFSVTCDGPAPEGEPLPPGRFEAGEEGSYCFLPFRSPATPPPRSPSEHGPVRQVDEAHRSGAESSMGMAGASVKAHPAPVRSQRRTGVAIPLLVVLLAFSFWWCYRLGSDIQSAARRCGALEEKCEELEVNLENTSNRLVQAEAGLDLRAKEADEVRQCLDNIIKENEGLHERVRELESVQKKEGPPPDLSPDNPKPSPKGSKDAKEPSGEEPKPPFFERNRVGRFFGGD